MMLLLRKWKKWTVRATSADASIEILTAVEKAEKNIWKVVSADPFDKTKLRDISDVEAEIVQQ